ncbi:hypothetical protein BOX37_10080 [Nocardia mangyaensis]|uniref:Uncharacterized protein n=1 Tax=Nocardia mangyaensis TaxID=2213200 RepID=A0A1J0VQE7_9NOCA|nr:hypothetical protein [Nocardia mangyaensis]APE34252.1 hypothetical protein BOX37_10080 [Nocardia mangyaensis]
MTDRTTLPRTDSGLLRDALRTPAARRARRRAERLASVFAGRLRLAVVAGLALTIAAVTGLVGAVFALAALVRGLEQVLPTWAAYAATAALLLTCAAIAVGACAWTLLRATGPAGR